MVPGLEEHYLKSHPKLSPDLPQHSKARQTMAPRRARKRVEGTASSNVFSMFDQSQIQEFKEAFTIMDQNRDGFIDKEDLRDTFAALGRINVKNEELEAMVKEAPGPINFTVFLTMFGEKLKGTDPEETILHAFKVFDTEGKGFVKADFIKEKLMTQADRFSEEESLCNPQLPFPGQADVCSFPARCLWQLRLQESVLRHHTRRGEGLDVSPPYLESAKMGLGGQGAVQGYHR
ncbi:myosin regulatory light chain 10 isoform X1 [Mus musculus]|uniref:myosin regulatory light chain 10 isoform X1 n=1 Tax=Mus musculus TaxID=10090 RepID=UPI0007EC72DC|nr:myosin regulatory light chain 10 isoform X1 [Mus musculus]|eukprot:XP_017176539.1 PREDICTED: myosin regulatory light chain 10 isoform X1 [Mus musculus]